MEVTQQELDAFTAGKATPEQIDRVLDDLKRPNSVARKYLEDVRDRVSRPMSQHVSLKRKLVTAGSSNQKPGLYFISRCQVKLLDSSCYR